MALFAIFAKSDASLVAEEEALGALQDVYNFPMDIAQLMAPLALSVLVWEAVEDMLERGIDEEELNDVVRRLMILHPAKAAKRTMVAWTVFVRALLTETPGYFQDQLSGPGDVERLLDERRWNRYRKRVKD